MLAYHAKFYFQRLSHQIIPNSAPSELKQRFDQAVLAATQAGHGFAFDFSLQELYGQSKLYDGNALLSLHADAVEERGHCEYSHGVFNIPFLFTEVEVNQHTALPRKEMILSTLAIIEEVAKRGSVGKTFLDLGCGCGFVAIALKKRFPDLQVIAADISAEAIEVTRRNAVRNQVDIDCCVGDLFEPLQQARVDYCAFYAPQSVNNWSTVSHYSEFDLPEIAEPLVAFMSGPKGLDLMERVCDRARHHLSPGGLIWLTGRCIPEAINWLAPHLRVHAVTHPDAIRGSTFFFENTSS